MFCLVKGAERDGFCKIVGHNGDRVVVEYFDSPADRSHMQLEVSTSSVIRRRLGRNTRVFTLDEAIGQWRIGRVRDDDGMGVEVRFAEKKDVYLEYSQVFVRWKRPIRDPVHFLAHLITETPQFAEARSGFLKSYLAQRGAAFGIKALLSSAVELEAHQINVVRRVLTDHSQRYLLADEVGLGKTIEAGVIIRQAVLDDLHHHKVVVLVPMPLVNQWRRELSDRFGLRDFIDESVLVLPQEKCEDTHDALEAPTLLVIDEVHRLADPKAEKSIHNLYRVVAAAAQRADRLLLLSATPILRNEEGFLRILSLLDPIVYPLADLDSFHEKVVNRQALAETVAALDPSNALFMDSALEDLLRRLPSDPRLCELTESLKERLMELPEENDPKFVDSVTQLRAHISETYCLNRRILRNRRRQVAGLTPNRSGVEIWQVQNSGMARLEAALEDWRISASMILSKSAKEDEERLVTYYWKAISSLLEDLNSLRKLCNERLRLEGAINCSLFEDEKSLIQNILSSIDEEEWMGARLERLYEGLMVLSEGEKAVIFCSQASVADKVFDYLRVRQSGRVRRHAVGGHEGDGEADWRDFITSSQVLWLVCDHHAEEGVNLQGGDKVVVHFDLPLEPNRIEQRMGRVDRYGAGAAIKSFALIDEGASIQAGYLGVLERGLGVFNQSISSLQYLVEAEVASLKASLLYEGIEAVEALRDRLAGPNGLAAQELKQIDQQDALDQLSPLPDADLDDLFDVDSDWRDIRGAALYWVENTLLFTRVDELRTSNAAVVEQPFRFHYCSPDADHVQPTLIPAAGFIEDFLGAIDFEAKGSRSTRPISYPYVSHRQTAVKRMLRPLRYGTEFIDAIKAFSDRDDRGRSYAMWRQFVDEFDSSELKMCFRFNFVIETCLDEAESILSSSKGTSSRSARAVLARRGDSLFAPAVMQVWLDEEGERLSDEFVNKFLSPEYRKESGYKYVDKNLKASHMRALQRMDQNRFANWKAQCERMRARALEAAMSCPELRERQQCAVARGKSEYEIRYAQLRSRIQSLHGRESEVEASQLDLEVRLNEAIRNGILKPQVSVDVAGVVFLTNDPVSLIQRYMKDDT